MSGKVRHDQIADGRLGSFTLRSDFVGDELPGSGISRIGMDSCLQVHGPLVIVPNGLKQLDQIT